MNHISLVLELLVIVLCLKRLWGNHSRTGIIDQLFVLCMLTALEIANVYQIRRGQKVRKLGDEERKHYGEYISWIYEIITALRDIRILGAGEKVEEDFEQKQKKILKLVAKNKITVFTAENLITFIQLAIRLSIYILSAYLVVKGNVTLGILSLNYS